AIATSGDPPSPAASDSETTHPSGQRERPAAVRDHGHTRDNAPNALHRPPPVPAPARRQNKRAAAHASHYRSRSDSSSARRSRSRPRASRDITVPIGTPVTAAISLYESPSS